ncbi:hypothetical protein BH23ACT9_BH23ACT9_31020 [soil metagenome]
MADQRDETHEPTAARTDDRSATVRDDLTVELPSNGHAIGALVTGMLAATLAFLVLSAPAAIILGIAAIVLGVMGVSRANDRGNLLKGTAISGIVSGALGLLLGLAVVVGGIALIQGAADDDGVQSQIDRLQQEVERLTVPELQN